MGTFFENKKLIECITLIKKALDYLETNLSFSIIFT